MGESFLGLPNRFKIINGLLESTYNPNHALSAYQGYRLATDYVSRTGGEGFAMNGNLYTKSLMPSEDAYYGKYGSLYGDDIGAYKNKYRYIYAVHLYGSADSATRLTNSITLSVTGAVTGSATFNGGGNVDLNVTSSHNHDNLYLPLTGGTLTGNIIFNGNDIGIFNKNRRQLLAEDSSGVIHIGRGPYTVNTGSLTLYSKGYMNLYTQKNDIRIVMGYEQTSVKPYVSIGADTTGSYIKYSKLGTELYMKNNNVITYNGYTIYHSGNLNCATANHNHDGDYLSLSGGIMSGNIIFSKVGYGIRDDCNHDILTFNTCESPTGLYDIAVGKGLLRHSKGGKTILYSHKWPVTIYTKGTYDALELKSDGDAYVCMGCSNNGSYIRSRYYDNSNALNVNTLRIPFKSGEDLTYNGNTIYHSGNLKLSDYSNSDHTHDYIPTSEKTSATSVSHTNYPYNQSNVPTMQFLSYWNGAYNINGGSNLSYCSKGQFGTIVTKNAGDYLASSGSVTLAGSLTISGTLANVLKVYKITPPADKACVVITRTGSQGSDGNFLDAAIDDLASDRIVPSSILTGINTGSTGNITIGIDSKASSPGLYVKLVKPKVEVLDTALNKVGASYTIEGYANVYCGALTCSNTATAKSFKTSSDIRLKEDIEQIDINQSIKILSKLSPVSYKLIDSETDSRDRGLIAQQLKEVMMDEGCRDQIYNTSEDGNMSISYTQLIPDIINVLKYLLYKVDKDSIEDIAKSLKFDEEYYREHAEEIANK